MFLSQVVALDESRALYLPPNTLRVLPPSGRHSAEEHALVISRLLGVAGTVQIAR